MDNSLYGLPQGSAYSQEIIRINHSATRPKKQGYTSNVMHGDYKTFWNRDQVYNISVLTISMMLLTMTCLTTILLILV